MSMEARVLLSFPQCSLGADCQGSGTSVQSHHFLTLEKEKHSCLGYCFLSVCLSYKRKPWFSMYLIVLVLVFTYVYLCAE